jgi:hypothetical protein
MKRIKNNKRKNNSIVTTAATTLLSLTTILVIAGVVIITPLTAQAYVDPISLRGEPKAPMAASQDGNNVYVVWWTNRSGNWEVMFRASNDSGATFGDKINLSNSPDTQSQTAEILAVGNNTVFVTWWELNENVHPHTNESVLRVSTDAGQTFGQVINLGTNGTISSSGNATDDFLSSRGGGGGALSSASGGDVQQ